MAPSQTAQSIVLASLVYCFFKRLVYILFLLPCFAARSKPFMLPQKQSNVDRPKIKNFQFFTSVVGSTIELMYCELKLCF